MGSPREKFKLLKSLGAGAFAQTFKAEVLDEELRAEWGEVVALKIPLSKEKEKVLIKEIITSASIHMSLKGVDDPHIVRYLGFEMYDNCYVMVMEYVAGGNLRSYLGDIGFQRALAVDNALDITEQICMGLAKIHQCRIVHRDLKPENILLAENGFLAKITDFGIGRMLTSSQLASTTTGTIFYMPSEVLRGKGGHFYSDIYSMGVTCYEMLTGRVPFNGNSVVEIIEKICHGNFEKPSNMNPEIDEELEKIILKAIAPDPRKRYKTAEEFLKDLRAYRQRGNVIADEIERCVAEARSALGCASPKEAAKGLSLMLKQYPKEEKAYLLVAEFYSYGLLHQEAVEVLRAGMREIPGSASLHRNIGLSLMQLGSLPEALQELEQALSLAPNENFANHLKLVIRTCQLKIKSASAT